MGNLNKLPLKNPINPPIIEFATVHLTIEKKLIEHEKVME